MLRLCQKRAQPKLWTGFQASVWTIYKRALFEKVALTLDSIICTEFLGDGRGRASLERLLKDH